MADNGRDYRDIRKKVKPEHKTRWAKRVSREVKKERGLTGGYDREGEIKREEMETLSPVPQSDA